MFLFDYLPNLDFFENFNKSRPQKVSQRSFQSVSNLVCGQIRSGGHTDGHDKASSCCSPLHVEAPKKNSVNL